MNAFGIIGLLMAGVSGLLILSVVVFGFLKFVGQKYHATWRFPDYI